MNLNKKISKFTGDGIPEYNNAINELIDAVNWLAGMRTINGKPIAESDQGPVLDLSQVNTTQTGPSPWATDPDGNPAGWTKVKIFDPSGQRFIDDWVWTGVGSDAGIAPWIQDLNGAKATWVSGAQGELWGTGTYPASGTQKYQQIKFTSSPINVSPTIYTGHASQTPIVPPASPPAIYFLSPVPSTGAIDKPYFPVQVSANPTDQLTVNFSWTITYDGSTVFSFSGSQAFNASTGFAYNFPLDPSGWVFDPQGLAGYTYGNQRWVYKYNGSVSSNTNPTIIETFTFTITPFSRAVSTYAWTAILLTG
jgi:hypothetical protein